jgi:hypothetical protein
MPHGRLYSEDCSPSDCLSQQLGRYRIYIYIFSVFLYTPMVLFDAIACVTTIQADRTVFVNRHRGCSMRSSLVFITREDVALIRELFHNGCGVAGVPCSSGIRGDCNSLGSFRSTSARMRTCKALKLLMCNVHMPIYRYMKRLGLSLHSIF